MNIPNLCFSITSKTNLTYAFWEIVELLQNEEGISRQKFIDFSVSRPQRPRKECERLATKLRNVGLQFGQAPIEYLQNIARIFNMKWDTIH